MMAQLAEAITKRLKDDGLDVLEVGFNDLVNGVVSLRKPSVNVVVQSGTFQEVTFTSYKNKLDVSVYVVFQGMKGGIAGEAQRREGTYEILEGVVQSLMLQKLGLDLESPLFPVSFRNVTSPEYAKAGFLIYQLMFWTSFIFTQKDPSGDLGMLKSVLAQYYLQPRDYTGMIGVTGPEASDLITLATGVLA